MLLFHKLWCKSRRLLKDNLNASPHLIHKRTNKCKCHRWCTRNKLKIKTSGQSSTSRRHRCPTKNYNRCATHNNLRSNEDQPQTSSKCKPINPNMRKEVLLNTHRQEFPDTSEYKSTNSELTHLLTGALQTRVLTTLPTGSSNSPQSNRYRTACTSSSTNVVQAPRTVNL